MTDKHVLGIDTSNYKTSIAVVKDGETLVDIRRFLKVREGERGLRQSEALFQHVQNLPDMFAELREVFSGKIDAVAYSTRPRSVEGSYMPCFTAGSGQAVSIASALDVPAVGFSHQEGHIEAVLSAFAERPEGDFAACHFSGGTCELLKVTQKKHEASGASSFTNLNGESAFWDIEITGGTKDISYGQVLDRAGVAMGMSFPCGQELDLIAIEAENCTDDLTRINVQDAYVHLSGFDTQIRNTLHIIQNGMFSFIREVFEKMSDSIILMLVQNAEKTGINRIYMSGGVSSSRFIREYITGRLAEKGIKVFFADAGLSSDNAVGTALLGNRYLWD